jgi:orotidine-5'-phosphate decarboxylase
MTELILALDRMSMSKALQFAKQAHDRVWGFKVNDLLLHYGAEIVYELKKFGNVMADPKLHDIPNTINNSIEILRSAGADIITVHASANYVPVRDQGDFLAGITVLTSMNETTCEEIYGENINYVVSDFGNRLLERGYKHVVCSGHEVELMPHQLLKICPGIRPLWYQQQDDQTRRMTPKEARLKGADFVVIGRPLILAEDFDAALDKTLEELDGQE